MSVGRAPALTSVGVMKYSRFCWKAVRARAVATPMPATIKATTMNLRF